MNIPPAPIATVRALERKLGVSFALAQVLVRRGLGDEEAARAWLAARERHDPSAFAGIDAAVEVVLSHVRAGTRVTVHGDYDVDGVCSTAILVRVLRALGADVDWYLPSRTEDGYGLSAATVARLAERGTRLLLTADCAITAVDEVAQARALGPGRRRHRPPQPARRRLAARRADRASGPVRLPVRRPVRRRGVAYKLAAALLAGAGRDPAGPTRTSTSSPWPPWPTASRCATRTAASCARACTRWPRRPSPGSARCCAWPRSTRARSTRARSAFAWPRGSTPPGACTAPMPGSSSCSPTTPSAPRRSPTSSTTPTPSGATPRRGSSSRPRRRCASSASSRRTCWPARAGTPGSSGSSPRGSPSATTARA